MKRRGFFASVFALPAAVKAMQEAPVPKIAEPVKQAIPESYEFMGTVVSMSGVATAVVYSDPKPIEIALRRRK